MSDVAARSAPAAEAMAAPRWSWLDRAARSLTLGQLRRLAVGRLILVEPDGARHAFGPEDQPQVVVHVRHPAFYRRLAAHGSLGAGSGYIDDLWSCDDLVGLVRLFIRNQQALQAMDGPWNALSALVQRVGHWMRRNTPGGSRRNIAAHYDLGNAFYSLFLDETLTYSAGIFRTPLDTLAQASHNKLDHVCRKLHLRSGDEVVEIGAGWGSFALHAAQRFGCRVTTTTISREQHALAQERVRRAGLQDRVTVLFEDYRNLRGQYDKLVSIEMIEAVGHQYYDVFFRKCSSLLRSGGAMALQAITIADRYYAAAHQRVDFIKRHVFPGCCIPSVSALLGSAARASDLTPYHLEDITPHYARTLELWRAAFLDARDKVRGLGFPDSFLRLWEYYLCYCEAGFREREIGDVQLVLVKPGYRAQ